MSINAFKLFSKQINQLITASTFFAFSAVSFAGILAPGERSYTSENQGANICYQKTMDKSSVQASDVENFLNCLTELKTLSRLSAKWILLRKAHWKLKDSQSNSIGYELANNPYSPNESHYLTYNYSNLHYGNLQKFIDQLQGSGSRDGVFDKALNGFIDKKRVRENRTGMSFEGAVYQNVAFVDTPLQYWGKRESSRNHYMGTLMESKKYPTVWYAEQAYKFPQLQTNHNKDYFWPELREIFNAYSFCKTSCLERMERRVLQGLFVTLEHPQFVRKVHREPLEGFGAEVDGQDSQEQLPLTIGCYKPVQETVPTGYSIHRYSLASGDEDFTKYGSYGMQGRLLYIEAINKGKISKASHVDSPGFGRLVPAHYTGQNAIIRKISDAAVADLRSKGGLGGSPFVDVDCMGYTTTGGATGSDNRCWLNTADVITNELTDVSFLMADYQKKKGEGESVKNHPVSQSAFFKETIISKNHSLKKWTDWLQNWNKGVYYHVFSYDHGLRPLSPSNPWRSYYDRVVEVADRKFSNLEM